MDIHISVASKTFLVGEYIALRGEPCIVVNTQPRFPFHFHQSTTETLNEASFAKGSPSHRLLAHYPELHNYRYHAFDPHHKQGGFGASTAEFAALFSLMRPDLVTPRLTMDQVNQILTIYWDCTRDANNQLPSGADLIGQINGQITYFARTDTIIKSLSWPFKTLDFYLLRTGHKVPTHEHLKQNIHFPQAKLAHIARTAFDSLQRVDKVSFINSINQYQELLVGYELQSQHTQDLLATLKKTVPIQAAKGCGALGADVIAVFLFPEHKNLLYQWAKEQELALVADHTQLTDGLIKET
ncbi:MAG: hypothetical protein Tsb005_02110 [Gammaproteobacteria bacterium]